MRPVAQMKAAAKVYPIHTQIHACHHDTPATTAEEAIIHVLILKESAIQNPTKFHGPHCLRCGSTVNILVFEIAICAVSHTRLQILIRQHQLARAQSRLALHRQFIQLRLKPTRRRGSSSERYHVRVYISGRRDTVVSEERSDF